MRIRRLRDARLDAILSELSPYSPQSLSDAIGESWNKSPVIGRDERIYGLTFLMVLNVISSRFGEMNEYFERGWQVADEETVNSVLDTLYGVLQKRAYLSDSGITSSKGVEQADNELRNLLSRIHNAGATENDYSLAQLVHDNLVRSSCTAISQITSGTTSTRCRA